MKTIPPLQRDVYDGDWGEDLSAALLDSLLGLRRARGVVERASGRLLARAREERVHHECGYRSFADFCRERIEVEPRTAQLRIALSRIVDSHPDLEEELVEGRLSPCQIRELGPVARSLSGTELHDWIVHARGLTVRQIRRAVEAFVVSQVKNQVGANPCESEGFDTALGTAATRDDRGATPHGDGAASPGVDDTATAGHHDAASVGAGGAASVCGGVDGVRATKDSRGGTWRTESPGVTLLVSAPAPTRVAWARGVELARKVLGWDAPQCECLSAMLMEAGAAPAPVESRPDRGLYEAGSEHYESGVLGDLRRRVRARAFSCRGGSAPSGVGPRSLVPVGRGSGSGEPACHDPGLRNPDLVEWGVFSDRCLSVPEALRRKARDVISQVRGELTDLDRLLAGTELVDPVAGLEELRIFERPLTILLSRALAIFREIHGPSAFGYPDLESFALVELGMSARSVRSAVGQVALFESAPLLEEAYVSARLGMGKAMLVGRAARRSGRARAWIARAESVTHRQLEREVRLHERLGEVDRDLAWKHRDPWSVVELEMDLRDRLAAVGRSAEDVERQLRSEGIATVGPASPVVSAASQRKVSGKRFRVETEEGPESLHREPEHEMHGRCFRVETGANTEALPGEPEHEMRGKCFRVETEENTESLPGEPEHGMRGKCFRVETEGSAPRVESEEPTGELESPEHGPHLFIDPATDPLCMRRLERLLDMLTLALFEDSLDLGRETSPVGRLELRPEGDRASIRVWLPERVHQDWCAFRSTVRGRFGPVPDWVVLTVLLDEAIRAWLAIDSDRRPTEWKILERDDYRCQAPGCSSRSRLEVHHVVFRSQGGSEDAANKVTLCHWHHHHGVHDGVVHVTGRAPGGLHWRLGGPVPRRFHGDAIV